MAPVSNCRCTKREKKLGCWKALYLRLRLGTGGLPFLRPSLVHLL